MTEFKRNDISAIDIGAFRQTYDASLVVMQKIVPFLPDEHNGIRASLVAISSEIPRMIAAAAGFDAAGSRPVLAPALARVSEAIVLLSYCRDLHGRHINEALCNDLLGIYREAQRELISLAISEGIDA